MLQEYQDLIKKTAVYPKEIGIAYCSLGLAGEAGEIANKVKKMYRDDNLHSLVGDFKSAYLYKKKDDIKAELGDVLWYITALAQECDLTLEEIMKYNMEKLLGRRERGTIQGSGDNR
jgi:NTP pyrophosphatase (non-canonical NTP hydrolase)